MNDLREQFDEAARELIRKHSIACDELTQMQLAESFKQALACGDFVRHVRASDNAQQVYYFPYRDAEMLRARVRHLEELLGKHGIDEWAQVEGDGL